jgi:amidase
MYPLPNRRSFLASSTLALSSAQFAAAEQGENSLVRLSARDLAERIAKKEVSCVDVMRQFLHQIESVNSKLNAVVQLRPGRVLLDEARKADQHLRQHGRRGPLHGIPFTLKDNIETEGIVTTSGFPELETYIPKKDASVARRLKEAGAILLGKTNVPEFLMYMDTTNLPYGRTVNPYDLSCYTGGSSGGEAAIIAACGSAFGIGTDIGSSIREPSHFCGIAGLKPTSGRVPDTGVLNCFPPYNSHWNSTGPMARYVRDLAIVTSVISGPDGFDPNVVDMPLRKARENVRGLRVAYFVDDGASRPTEDTRRIVRRCAQKLADLGAQVTEAQPPGIADATELWVFGMVPELGTAMRQWLGQYAKMANTAVCKKHLRYTDDLLRVFDFWSNEGRHSEERRFSIGRRIHEFRSNMLSFMQQFDLLLCPVMNGPAEPFADLEQKEPQPLEQEFEQLRASGYSYCMAFNITGWPAASVPVGQTAAGLPLGVQVAAGAWCEDLVLTVAGALEKHIGGWRPPQALLL